MQFLYRAYDADNKLLYVGISVKWSERLHQHEKDSAWIELADYVKIERFPDRDSVVAAEKVAIETELPLYNKMHSQSYESVQDHFQQIKLWLKATTDDERHALLMGKMRTYFDKPEMAFKKKRSQDVAWAFQTAYAFLSRVDAIECRNCEAIFNHGMYQRWASLTDAELEERGYFND